MQKYISPELLKNAIAYYYLLSYIPPERIAEFRQSTSALCKDLAEKAGMTENDFFKEVLPEVCRRIVAFHQDTRDPDPQWVDGLVSAARQVDQNTEAVAAFQTEMSKVARLEPRALPENRLHRKKGCAFCRQPCTYGYFSLVSEPEFKGLRRLLESEASLPKNEQNPLRPVWTFTISHLARTTQANQGVIQQTHLGNLAFCMLLLSTAKSRLALPDAELQAFQANNQILIQSG
jgi:hypothetical protein